jgi:hypothetical protein
MSANAPDSTARRPWGLRRALLWILLATVALGTTAGCDQVNDSLTQGSRQGFVNAANDFTTTTSTFINEVNAVFDSGDTKPFLAAGPANVTKLGTAVAAMRKNANALDGARRTAANKAVDAADAMHAASLLIVAGVKAKDPTAAQSAVNRFDTQRDAFNNAMDAWRALK